MGLICMNKSDIKLLIIIVIIAILLLLLIRGKTGSYAYVYYENKVIKKIDLNIDEIYTVSGYNGDIVIEVKNKSIAVIKETSPLNICSKQGFVKTSIEPIICLPNKIIVKIIEDFEEVDAVIR